MFREMGGRSERAIRRHDRIYRRWVRAGFRSGELVGLIAEISGDVVASACVWFRPDQPRPGRRGTRVPYVLSMYVERRFRGRKIATRLLRELMTVCRRRHFSWVTLHASREGRPVYRRLGFERTWEMHRPVTPVPKPRAR
jgi:GNAT superfamily N-acetyltransferase